MLPRASDGLEPVAATVRKEPSYTICKERLLRTPDGSGDHLWIRVRKIDISTGQTQQALARAVHCQPEDFKYIGTRDRFSDCEQWFSVRKDRVEHVPALKNAGYKSKVRVMEIGESARAISAGVLDCMEYTLRLGDAAANQGYLHAKAILDRLRQDGGPNYVAPSRFGKGGQLAKWGKLIASGKRLPRHVQQQKISKGACLQAWQGMLFNRYVAQRFEAGLLGTCLGGECILTGCQNTTVNRAEDHAPDMDEEQDGVEGAALVHTQKRLDSWEAIPLGPLFGTDMTPARDAARAYELAFLEKISVSEKMIGRLRYGGRRAIRFQPGNVHCEQDGDDLLVKCTLDPDVYITTLLEELLQTDYHIK